MATIDDMLANPTQYGTLGGMRQAQADARTQESFDTSQQQAELAIKQKQADLEDFLDQRAAKQAKYLAAQQEAERQTKNQAGLDDVASKQISATLQNLSSQIHSSQMDEIAQNLGDVKDQSSYNQFMKSTPKDELELVGITPTGDWNKDKGQLQHAATTALHSAKQMRELELASVRAAGQGGQSVRSLSPDVPKPLSQSDMPSIRSSLSTDPYFDNIWKSSWNPFANHPENSRELLGMTNDVITRANELMVNSSNAAKVANDPSKQIGQGTALQQAITEQKAMTFTTDSSHNIVPMDAQKYQALIGGWSSQLDQEMGKKYGTAWTGKPPVEKQRMIMDTIRSIRLQQYQDAVRQNSYGQSK